MRVTHKSSGWTHGMLHLLARLISLVRIRKPQVTLTFPSCSVPVKASIISICEADSLPVHVFTRIVRIFVLVHPCV